MNQTQTPSSAVDALMRQADAASAKQDWVAANDAWLKGLNTLGDRYASPDAVDDTGMRLVAAEAEERRGNLNTAATIRQRVLQTRLDLWRSGTLAT